MVANFRLKIAHLKAYSSASIDVIFGSPDSADFAMTRLLLPRLWHIGKSPLEQRAVMVVICQWSHNHCPKCQHSPSCFVARTVKSLWSIFCGSGSSRNGFAEYRSRHSAICQWIRSRVVAKSFRSSEPVFTSLDVLLHGLSRDTVPDTRFSTVYLCFFFIKRIPLGPWLHGLQPFQIWLRIHGDTQLINCRFLVTELSMTTLSPKVILT
jgi:hypothetical protein